MKIFGQERHKKNCQEPYIQEKLINEILTVVSEVSCFAGNPVRSTCTVIQRLQAFTQKSKRIFNLPLKTEETN